MERRTVLKGAVKTLSLGLMAPVVASTTLTEVTIVNPGKHNFVLVHGTWHGGWVWTEVAALLRAQGHKVITPTCTGCGDRVHLSTSAVGLDTHISDIENSIKWAEMDNIVLVGHSFSGITITGVADKLKDRIQQIIFFDAIVPRPGRMSGVVKDPKTGEYPTWWQERKKKFLDGYKMVLWEDYPVEMLVSAGYKKQIARLKKLITTHPAKQWTDELALKNGGWEGLPRAFIHCAGQKYKLTSEKMIGPARGPGWNFISLNIPRDGMLTHPKLVASQLITLAESQNHAAHTHNVELS
ncbi:MAG: pimeloyl-ACP methyl ester carboxylesterase [Flavobacteriales bacterium]|jgi:pimeloyl-ACP methyl ester carboxylesterase